MPIARLRSPLAALLAGLALLVAATAPLAANSSCQFTVGTVPVSGGEMSFGRVGEGPPVVLVHGLFADGGQWLGLACLLASSGYSAIAPDLPGFGRSTGFPVAVYQLRHQAARLNEFVDQLGLRDFALAGNSMGGAIAALYATEHPQRVRSLAFIGAPLGVTGWSHALRDAIRDGFNPFIPQDGAQLDVELALLFVQPPALPGPVREALLRERNDNYRHYVMVWNIVELELDALQPIRRFPMPTLAIWGTEDHVFSIGGAGRLRSRLPPHAFVALGGAGHLPHVEAPDRIAGLYLPFLARPPKPQPVPQTEPPLERPAPRPVAGGR